MFLRELKHFELMSINTSKGLPCKHIRISVYDYKNVISINDLWSCMRVCFSMVNLDIV